MRKRKIFLIGLPGSGKSTLGKEVSTALGYDFIDLDMEIEKLEGATIQQLFKKKGESYFREREAEVLSKMCDNPNCLVIATGGGTACFFNNMEIMNASGVTIFLDVPIMEIVRRLLEGGTQDRPLLFNQDQQGLTSRIELFHSQRLPYYIQSTFRLKSASISAKEIIDLYQGYSDYQN